MTCKTSSCSVLCLYGVQQQHTKTRQRTNLDIHLHPAVLQAISAQIPNDNDSRCMTAADVQRKANAELLRIFSGA